MQRWRPTLLEAFVIIMILGVAASMLIPSVQSTRGLGTYRVRCMSNLREIGKACVLYAADFGGYYPTVREKGTTTSRPLASLALLYDRYVSTPKIFVCPRTEDNCADMAAGQTFRPHDSKSPDGLRRACSYAYDDTREPNPSKDLVIAGDAPPADLGLKEPNRKTSKNSDNHQGAGQHVLLAGSDTVIWIGNATNPLIPGDDIYTAADPANPGASDSYIHQ